MQGSVWPGDRKCEGMLRDKAENVDGQPVEPGGGVLIGIL